ncbi:MAG: helix-turn-helix domain-containing protein [Chloroflexi bacterium]|nr:helix-turn-helix domain-containing protein [Chloroflexota bacterium]
MDDRWMTLQEIAEYLQLSKDLIYRLAQKGKIPASKVGGRWRFKKEKIDQWVESQGRGTNKSGV